MPPSAQTLTYMNIRVAFLIFSLFTLAMADPNTGVAPSEPQTQPHASPPTDVAAESQAGYVLQPGDELDIKFFFNPELNERATIRPDGRLSLPLLGERVITGATIAQLTQKLELDYKKELSRPQLLIQVRSFGNRNIFVGGEVQRPGMLQVFGQKTAMEALLEAGGLKHTAKKGEVMLIRRSDSGAPVTMLLAMNEKNSKKLPWAANFKMQPMDVLLVTESGISKVDRAIDQYFRQLVPVMLTGGFNYIWGPLSGAGGRF
jgi:polysaccharide biosynthesis/export protein